MPDTIITINKCDLYQKLCQPCTVVCIRKLFGKYRSKPDKVDLKIVLKK